MKIEIKQTKLIEILDYLYVNGLFPFSIVTIKEDKLFSVQSDKEGYAMRFASFHSDYFENIEGDKESVQWDIEKIKKFANLKKPESIIKIEYPVNKKLVVSGEGVKTNIVVAKISAEDIKDKLPFSMGGDKKNVPLIGKAKTPLDTYVVLSLAGLKKIASYASAHGTEFYKFKIDKDRQLNVFVGDLKAVEDSSEVTTNAQVLELNEELNVTFTKGIAELAKTFTGDVDVHFRSQMPAWFSEVTHNHKFGVLVTPIKE